MEILQYPDQRLKLVSEPVTEITDGLRTLARDMCEVMYEADAVGLAAPQIGRTLRMVVMDTTWGERERNPVVMINPKILGRRGTISTREGCLSIPNFMAEVERSAHIVVHYADLEGSEIVEGVEGPRAVCIQHEIDHLDGILFIDHL